MGSGDEGSETGSVVKVEDHGSVVEVEDQRIDETKPKKYIDQWCPRIKEGKVYVEGKLVGDSTGKLYGRPPYYTARIMRRLQANVLVGRGGRQYVLEHQLFPAPTCSEEFRAREPTQMILDMFAEGFPTNWERLVKEAWLAGPGRRPGREAGLPAASTSQAATPADQLVINTDLPGHTGDDDDDRHSLKSCVVTEPKMKSAVDESHAEQQAVTAEPGAGGRQAQQEEREEESGDDDKHSLKSCVVAETRMDLAVDESEEEEDEEWYGSPAKTKKPKKEAVKEKELSAGEEGSSKGADHQMPEKLVTPTEKAGLPAASTSQLATPDQPAISTDHRLKSGVVGPPAVAVIHSKQQAASPTAEPLDVCQQLQQMLQADEEAGYDNKGKGSMKRKEPLAGKEGRGEEADRKLKLKLKMPRLAGDQAANLVTAAEKGGEGSGREGGKRKRDKTAGDEREADAGQCSTPSKKLKWDLTLQPPTPPRTTPVRSILKAGPAPGPPAAEGEPGEAATRSRRRSAVQAALRNHILLKEPELECDNCGRQCGNKAALGKHRRACYGY